MRTGYASQCPEEHAGCIGSASETPSFFTPKGWEKAETRTSPRKDRAPEPHKGDDGLLAKVRGRHSPGRNQRSLPAAPENSVPTKIKIRISSDVATKEVSLSQDLRREVTISKDLTRYKQTQLNCARRRFSFYETKNLERVKHQ